jgi:hypothetical protein
MKKIEAKKRGNNKKTKKKETKWKEIISIRSERTK